MMSTFYSLYSHDFIRVASGVPRTRVADVPANLAKKIRLARQGDALKAALMIFPELGLSAYAIDDLLFQDALLQFCRSSHRAIGGDLAGALSRIDRRSADAPRGPTLQRRRRHPSREHSWRRAEDLSAELP